MAERTLFISHASEDTAVVQRIVDYLEREGITCWIAGRDIPPRAVYAEAITEGVKNASACGVIVSRAANASDAIKRELELASRYKRPFIPIRIEDVEPGPGLDYYLNNVQWMEYKRDGNAALDRIVAHMRGQAYLPPPKAERAKHGLPVAAWIVVGLIAIGGATYAGYSLNNAPPPQHTAEQQVATTSVATGTPSSEAATTPLIGKQAASPAPRPQGRAALAAPAIALLDRVTLREWSLENQYYHSSIFTRSGLTRAALQAAADEGDAKAQYILSLFLYGEHQRDLSTEYARRSAEQGFAPAQFDYSILLDAEGRTEESVRWMRRAADQGNATAQIWLGQLYMEGSKVPRDLVEGRRLLGLAAAQGSTTARDILEVWSRERE